MSILFKIIMTGWEPSVLNLLRKAAVKLNMFQEYRPLDIYEMMSERELASLIHQHYQVHYSFLTNSLKIVFEKYIINIEYY